MAFNGVVGHGRAVHRPRCLPSKLPFPHLRECVESRHISVLLCSQPLLCDTDTSTTVGVVLMLALTAFEPLLVTICPFCVSTDRTLLAGVLRANVI